MSDADYEWRTRLQSYNLVIEANFTVDEVREAQSKYGTAARHLLNQGVSHRKIINRYPALTLMILVGHASLAYDQGAYWESFWEELGIGRDAEFEVEIRRSVVDLLDKFSLARFPDIERESSRKYVMMFALHAGIPVHCLRDLLVLINEHITQGRPATGAALMEWLQEPGKEHRASTLDVPVRNFLLNGAEFAADILDRIIEFIEVATADPQFFERHLDSSTTGLPSVLLEELIEQLKTKPLHFERKRLATVSGLRPGFTYLIDDDEVVLTLPTPQADADVPWRVSLDGHVREVLVARRWGGEASTAAARAPVSEPIREAIISHPALAAATALPLVVQSDPLLTFDQNGRWIARGDGLKDCVWAIYPEDHQLVDSRTLRQVESQDSGRPAGWHGWRSAFVDLDGVDALQLLKDETPIGTSRWVRKDARPRFELGPVIPATVTLDGRTVYGRRPWVLLPATRTDSPPTWTVRVRPLGESEWIVDEAWLGEEVETCVDPFDDVEEPQLGLFEILVTGPMGSDARCVAFLAEGVEATFEPAIRVPVSGGLSTCTAVIASEGLAVTPGGPVEFGARDIEVELELGSGHAAGQILLKPLHVEIRSGEVGVPIAWRMTADVCDPDDFTQDRFVAIRAPGVERVQFAYFSELGDLLQLDSTPRRRQGDVFESRTQQFADTVRSHPSGRIVATLHTEVGPIEVTVLRAQPRRLATAVSLNDTALEFVDAAALDDMAVFVWSTTAPWRAAEVLPIVDGKATLPEHLVDAGELRCQLFIDDPWVLIDPPTIPPETAFRVEQPGWRKDGTRDQVELSHYLGGPCSAHVEVGVMPEVWAALARLHADGTSERFAGLIKLLVGAPRKALECLGDSTIPAGEKMAMLIRSELVNHNFSAKQTLNELHSHPWFGCMVELADLPSLYNRRDEVRVERAETLAYLQDRGGAVLTELLQTGKATRFHDASFDTRVMEMSFVPRNRVEAKLREIQQVPRAQLHPENLRVGVYEALCRRTEWMSSAWSPNFAQQAVFVVNPIKRASPLAHEAITLRIDRLRGIDVSENPWMLMSVESLTLAFLARLEAYRRIEGRYLNSGLLRDWARLAHLCPTMVANDLLIAEAVVLYDRRGDLTGEDK
ncbi:hypothetical protein [[Mycobacterium] burgundiense]|uniref:Uncharacterized protein n=1 Tax=[Mycobacterium] burgundiense TaxID=3064286 RepID=A0ABN9N9X9_9MYCO|nr:hypothetical protein [Mycolicibacterium sp. MU0053]CAJ1501171.1 hypothetical protein MU0053_001859 [Mycolicibacterium sp. MU0053]